MNKKNRKKNFTSIGDILYETLKKRKIPVTLLEGSVWKAWNQAVGKIIAAQTNPVNVKNKTLFVHVSTSVWLQQLQFMKREIITKVNNELQKAAVENLHFSIGPIPETYQPSKTVHNLTPQGVLTEKEKNFIAENAKTIADQELKEIIERLMMKSLLEKKQPEDRQKR